MKKMLLSAVMAGISFGALAQQRTVLYEEFTGENCMGGNRTNDQSFVRIEGKKSAKNAHWRGFQRVLMVGVCIGQHKNDLVFCIDQG